MVLAAPMACRRLGAGGGYRATALGTMRAAAGCRVYPIYPAVDSAIIRRLVNPAGGEAYPLWVARAGCPTLPGLVYAPLRLDPPGVTRLWRHPKQVF